MKVLTTNIKLFFKCNECPNEETQQSDPNELCLSGVPICPICEEEMELDEECIIKN